MASMDGSWKIVIDSSMGVQQGVLTVNVSGDSFTGTFAATGNSVAVEDGKVDGDALSWKMNVVTPFPATVDCRATVTGNTMTGTADVLEYGNYPLTGTRK
jgi:hypothetical protein